jgi:hypothetical protein
MDHCLQVLGYRQLGDVVACVRGAISGSFQTVARNPGFATTDDWITVGLALAGGIAGLIWLAARAVRITAP